MFLLVDEVVLVEVALANLRCAKIFQNVMIGVIFGNEINFVLNFLVSNNLDTKKYANFDRFSS